MDPHSYSPSSPIPPVPVSTVLDCRECLLEIPEPSPESSLFLVWEVVVTIAFLLLALFLLM